ncbi:MAG: hydrogenase iron-sulfur subunit [Desulfobacterales bacterium]|nr:hydrogenase iron-sulfur subunit [Desulfobacterales bacterium]
MCSGRVDMAHVLRAFSNGMDGVFIGACHLNECNYVTHGNFNAMNMVLLFKKIMEHIGLNPDRLRMQFMSGAEANVFVESTNSFIKTIKGLGPLGKNEGLDDEALSSKLAQIAKLVPYIKIATKEKLNKRLNQDEYEGYFTKDEIAKLVGETPSYYIQPDKCQACMACARRCPVEAIISAKHEVHVIDQDKCIKCGTCIEVCPTKFSAITKFIGHPAPPPPPEGKRAIVRKSKEKEAA